MPARTPPPGARPCDPATAQSCVHTGTLVLPPTRRSRTESTNSSRNRPPVRGGSRVNAKWPVPCGGTSPRSWTVALRLRCGQAAIASRWQAPARQARVPVFLRWNRTSPARPRSRTSGTSRDSTLSECERPGLPVLAGRVGAGDQPGVAELAHLAVYGAELEGDVDPGWATARRRPAPLARRLSGRVQAEVLERPGDAERRSREQVVVGAAEEKGDGEAPAAQVLAATTPAAQHPRERSDSGPDGGGLRHRHGQVPLARPDVLLDLLHRGHAGTTQVTASSDSRSRRTSAATGKGGRSGRQG